MNHVCDRISRLRIASANNAPSFERKLGFINQEKGSNFFLFQILSLLKREGYIRFFNIYTHKRFLHVTIYLKYNLQGSAPFQSIFPVSTPGRSIFISANSL
jgi:ribosomal protein S8